MTGLLAGSYKAFYEALIGYGTAIGYGYGYWLRVRRWFGAAPLPSPDRQSDTENANEFTLAGAAANEFDLAVGDGEQRVVSADADILAGVNARAALAYQNMAGLDGLAAEALYAQTLALRIAAVARTAACFLVCHIALLLRR